MGWLEDMLGYGGAPRPDTLSYLQDKGTVGLGVPQLQDPLGAKASAGLPSARPPVDYASGAQQAALQQQNAVRAEAAAQAAKDSMVAEQTALSEAQRASAERAHHEASTKLYADTDARQKAILDEAAKAPPIDPGKFSRDLGAGGQIGALVTGFLSGFVNPKGGGDDVVQLITGLTDRNVQAQIANNAQRDKLLGLKQSALNNDFSRGRDRLDTELAATAREYDGAIRLVKAEAEKKWGGTIGDAKAQQLISGIQQSFLEKLKAHRENDLQIGAAQMNAQTQRQSQLEATRHNQVEEGLSAAQLGIKANLATGPLAGLKPDEARKLEIHGADGKLLGYGYDPDDAKATRTRIIQYEDFRKDLTDYRDLVEKFGHEFSGVGGVGRTEAYASMLAKHKRLITTAKEIQKLGVLTGPDVDLLEGQIPPPQGSLGGANPLPALADAIQHGDEAIDRFIRVNIQGAKRYSPVSGDELGGTRGGTVTPGTPAGRPGARGLPSMPVNEDSPLTAPGLPLGSLRQ